MIVGGNIDGVTRVMTTAIALETSKGDLPLALALGIVLLAVVALLNVVIALVPTRQRSPLAASPLMTRDVRPSRWSRCATRRCASAPCSAVRDASARDPARRVRSPSSAPTARARPRCCACCTASSRTRERACVAAAAPRQAMVFQRPFLLRLSVLNNLRLALWLGDGVPPRARAERARSRRCSASAWPALRDRPARSLSGGEQQRLALARGWAVRPDILFLDEPTANLDPSAKKEVEALLAGFAADGMTLVMSTHNLGQAKRLATRVVYMDDGRIDVDLPTADFFSVRRQPACRPVPQGRSVMVSRMKLGAAPPGADGAGRRGVGAACGTSSRRTSSSRWRRPPAPSSRACSRTCCRRSRRRPGSTFASSPSAPARRSTSAGAATPIVLFVHDRRPRRSSSPKACGLGAARGDVQRLRPDRSEERSGRR